MKTDVINQTQENVNLNPVPNPEQPSKKLLIIGLLLTLLIISGLTGLVFVHFYKQNDQTKNINSTSSNVKNNIPNYDIKLTPTPIQIPDYNGTGLKQATASGLFDLGNNIYEYVKKDFGFGVIFSKYDYYNNDTCDPKNPTDHYGYMPIVMFDDEKNGILYLADSEFRELQFAPDYSKAYYDTCKIVKTTIDIIKNGYYDKISDSTSYPRHYELYYKEILTDNDLNVLLHTPSKYYPAGCTVFSKTADKNMEGVLDIVVTDKNGQNGNQTECPIVAYHFYYSPKTQSAVLSLPSDSAPFGPPILEPIIHIFNN